ncbi:ABC transporter permease subunit [Paenisporosarcina indica]|uniref:ABC transporter permease subunit n=1 Tax=Paenisporosarcina indica TaxID=650093 RepID=UPI00094F59AE|nr:hypothetical protein [Paenisporosarcina indica]
MQLLKFELYKLFKQKIIYITFFLLIIFSTGFTFETTTDSERELYKQWEGSITEETLQQAEIESNKITKKIEGLEFGIPLSENEQIKYGIYENIAFIQGSQRNREEKLKQLENENNYNTKLEQEMITKVDRPYFSYSKAPMEIIDYASFYAIFITGAMLLIGLSSIYTNETSSGTDNYILSSKKGRNSLAWAKITASLIFTVIVVLAWEVFNIGINFIKFGIGDWQTPIQNMFKYFFSPYGLNMFDFHLIQLSTHLLAAFCFALLIILVSSVSKNSLISFLINGVIFAIPIMFVETVMMPNWLRDVFSFSFIYLMKVEFLFEGFKTVNLFGFPVIYPILAVIWMIVMSIVFVMLTLQVIKNKEVMI